MKNYLKFGIVVLLSVVMFACDKDDDVSKEDEKANPLEFNDQTFSWNDNAEIWYYKDDQYYDMNLFTGSLKVDRGLFGSGDWLNVEFYTPTAGTLEAGDYVISDNLEEGTCLVDFDFDVVANGQNYTSGSSSSFVSGKVTIKGAGNTYTVTFDAIDDDGKELKGTVTSNFAMVNTN